MRSLPRSEKVPVVVCHEPHENECEEMPSEESLPSCSQNKTEMARLVNTYSHIFKYWNKPVPAFFSNILL